MKNSFKMHPFFISVLFRCVSTVISTPCEQISYHKIKQPLCSGHVYIMSINEPDTMVYLSCAHNEVYSQKYHKGNKYTLYK